MISWLFNDFGLRNIGNALTGNPRRHMYASDFNGNEKHPSHVVLHKDKDSASPDLALSFIDAPRTIIEARDISIRCLGVKAKSLIVANKPDDNSGSAADSSFVYCNSCDFKELRTYNINKVSLSHINSLATASLNNVMDIFIDNAPQLQKIDIPKEDFKNIRSSYIQHVPNLTHSKTVSVTPVQDFGYENSLLSDAIHYLMGNYNGTKQEMTEILSSGTAAPHALLRIAAELSLPAWKNYASSAYAIQPPV
ncbi:MAG: hypothetical protein JWM96_171 [Alphaproteobacteria bacterium]|nr:hypothetical protein [Alphaproteobacteria bacterium]